MHPLGHSLTRIIRGPSSSIVVSSRRVLWWTLVTWTCSSHSTTRAMTTNNNNMRRVAVAQLTSTNHKLHNLLRVAQCAGTAARQDALLLCLPENFAFLGTSWEETLSQAEAPLEGDATPKTNTDAVTKILQETVQEYRQVTNTNKSNNDDAPRVDDPVDSVLDALVTIARASGLWISGGGMHVSGAPVSENGTARCYNTQVLLDDNGNLQAIYRKIHLFDLDIPGKVTLKESSSTAPGNLAVCVQSPIGKLGLTTCYDVRFPEQYTELVKRGAEVILVPSAFTVPTGQAHWHTLLKARAIETQCYVLASAQVGRHNPKRESYGHSLIVDPWGDVKADAGLTNAPEVLIYDLDLDYVRSIRQRMPIQEHRNAASIL